MRVTHLFFPRFAFVFFSALVLAACGGHKSPTGKPALEMQSCRLDGVPVESRCGKLEVFENRQTNSGRKIALNIAVIPSVSPNPQADPIVFFAGGPGQAAVKLSHGAFQILHKARREREIVLVDQRGTGKSNPLDCIDKDKKLSLAEKLADSRSPQFMQACLKKLDAAPEHYTTPNAVADMEDVRAALGYEKLNLWGISYGTRMALSYMRAQPQHVRSAVLDGVAPTAIKLPLHAARDAQTALQRTIDDCMKITACKNFSPELQQDLFKLSAALEKSPVKINLNDPATNEKTEVEINQRTFVSSLRSILYRADYASLLPLTLAEAKKGNYAPLIAQSTAFSSGLEESLSLGMFMSVICSEDVPLIGKDEILNQANPLFHADMFDSVLNTCPVWPKGKIPPEHAEPVKSDIPVLLLSGALDPATPPLWGDLVAKTLSRSKHVVAENLSHSVSQHGCFPQLMADFFKAGNADKLEVACVKNIPRPAFFTNFSGPPS
ncbi:MAG: alpha/beta fold hydrolase [Burkholderiales bacterium]